MKLSFDLEELTLAEIETFAGLVKSYSFELEVDDEGNLTCVKIGKLVKKAVKE